VRAPAAVVGAVLSTAAFAIALRAPIVAGAKAAGVSLMVVTVTVGAAPTVVVLMMPFRVTTTAWPAGMVCPLNGAQVTEPSSLGSPQEPTDAGPAVVSASDEAL
jgi:hypothetical protein